MNMYTCKSVQVVTDLKTKCNKVFAKPISGRLRTACSRFGDKSGTSCYHLVTRLMTVTDLLQVVPTRLIQAVRSNKLLTTCYVKTISDLLEQLDVSLLASSTLLQDDNNLFQTCQQLGTSSANTSC